MVNLENPEAGVDSAWRPVSDGRPSTKRHVRWKSGCSYRVPRAGKEAMAEHSNVACTGH